MLLNHSKSKEVSDKQLARLDKMLDNGSRKERKEQADRAAKASLNALREGLRAGDKTE